MEPKPKYRISQQTLSLKKEGNKNNDEQLEKRNEKISK
jgi:hypothetical protein